MKSIILGAGMSGLILAEIFAQNGEYEEITIYSEKALGQHSSKFDLGPRILHKTPKVEKFLSNLFDDYKEYERVYRIGTINRGCLLSGEEDYSKEYAKKLNKSLEQSTMSGGVSEIIGYDIRKMNLPNVLYNKHKDKVKFKRVDEEFINQLSWQNDVYCTLPYNEVMKMVYGNKIILEDNLEHEIFVWLDKEFEWPRLDYVYDISENNSVKRITKLEKGCVYEFVGVNPKIVQEIADIANKHKILGMEIQKVAMKKSEPVRFVKGLEMVGRFATNNHAEKMDTIIDRYLR